MKISVITPSYKQLRWLKLCTASVADQRGVCVEHIIQDAQTGRELEEWVQAHSNARLFVESDSGMYDAINRGFLKSTGDIVAWLNCDEQYLPDALAKVAAFFEKNPKVDVLFGDAVLLSEQGALLSYRRAIVPTLLHTQLSHLNTLSCATFVRRSVIERGLLLKTEWKAIADAVWMSDLIQARLCMAVLPEPLAAFTMTEENLGQSSLAFKESERWKEQTTTPWQRALRYPVIFGHRLRKFWHGAYDIRNFSTEIYWDASILKRTPVAAKMLSFTWTRSQTSDSRQHLAHDLFRAAVDFFKVEGHNIKPLPFNFYHPTHWPWIYYLLLPVFFTATILILEEVTSSSIIVTPMLSTIFMLMLSLRLEPARLLPFVVAFNGAIFYSLHYMQPFDGANSTHWIRLGLRIASFSIAATLAVLFSKYRCKAKEQLDQTMKIIISMPMPVVISDALGAVIFANDEASDFMHLSREKLQASNYIELFMRHQDEGTAMREYIKFFQNSSEVDRASLAYTHGLRTRGDDGSLHEVAGRLICLGQGKTRHMITVLKV